ncbi:protein DETOXIFICATION 21-like isoform X2 [Castanea sativa]|uniref:protein DETOXIFICATION 21-like isoform X2 n=1 Tax=Castanea sativa TaxID=21020 RepID=UPI003F649740
MEEDMNQKLLREVDAAGESSVVDQVPLRDKVWSEMKKMWVVAVPAIFTRASTFGINVITQAFVGHIGSTELAAYSFIYTVFLSFAIGILLGMATALQTLCGQAYGARKYHMLGVYLQRSWIVMFLASIILLPIFIFATQILEVFGQDEDVAKVGGEVAHWIIGAMFALVISYSSQMYLQSQSKNMLITYFAAFAILIHVLLSWLLTVKYKFGVPGAMLSTVLAFWIPNIGQLMFIMCGGCRETWKGFSSLAFQDLWAVMKLSLSSGVMLCLSINGWEMMIALGFMSTASVRVSNELGRGSAKAAKFSIVMTGLTSFAIGFVLFLFFLIFRGRVAYLFTENEEVALAFANMSPFLAVSVLLNSIQPVLSGVAIGAGLQSIVAYVNLTAYYLVGIPVGAVLGFVFDMEVKGVWIGMLFGTFVQTVVLIIMTYKTNWDEQVIIARNRVNRWTVKDSNEPDHTT